MSQIIPFNIAIPQAKIEHIKRRLAEYEWPPEPKGADWAQGTQAKTLRGLVERWKVGFDWRAQETTLNGHPQFIAEAGGIKLHYVHRRASIATAVKTPVVLMHGWPSSFIEYLDSAKKLQDDGHDVVIVSLPGFGFSDVPESFIGPRKVSLMIHDLMKNVLGYSRYAAHGSDWGSLIAGWLGFDFPDSCVGVHMTMLSPRFIAGGATEPAEQQWLGGFRERFADDGAYFQVQTSRPVTMGFLLSDSPVGLLAWMLEKFAAWSDPSLGDPSVFFLENTFADRMILNTMMYLVTGTAASSTWLYRGITLEGSPGYPDKKRVETPVCIAATKDPIFVPPPRSLVEKAYNVVRWTEYPYGGHFPGYDVPTLLAEDISEFVSSI